MTLSGWISDATLRGLSFSYCYSARKFDPLESRDLKDLARQSASNLRAEQQTSTATGSGAMLKTRSRRVKLRELALLEKNARYMTDAMFSQLVENIRRDGCLTSVPLVCETEDGRLEVLSGNHRVMAAIKAGLEEVDVMEITTPLNRERRIAIQLSHNAIAGLDDPSILTELWADLDFAFKEYSGLTEEDLAGITEIDTTPISVAAPKYEEINLAFLPEEKEAFVALLDRMQQAKTEARWLVAHYDGFSRLFDTIIAVKSKLDIHNGAVALRVMADLAMERLASEAKPGANASV